MAADGKKSKTEKASPKEKAEASPGKSAVEAKTESKTEGKTEAKTEGKSENKPESAAAKYHRGEGQKPVSQAYKDNWDAIYAKKKKKKRR